MADRDDDRGAGPGGRDSGGPGGRDSGGPGGPGGGSDRDDDSVTGAGAPAAPSAIAAARSLWAPAGVYLNTASYGLPPQPAWEALQGALADWRGGRTSWEHWGDATHAAREAFARLVHAEPAEVAVGATISGLIGLIAASLPAGTRVLVPDVEFTSNLFPWLVHAERGITVETVPAARLAEAIDARTNVVAFSAVQSATGEVADLDAIVAAAGHHDALTVVDGTQACGWLPLDARRFDALAVSAYKWLMSPRGSAFMTLRPPLLERVRPDAAGWFAAEDVHAAYYGPPLRLAADARRLDTSPAWFSWVGTTPALELVRDLGVEAIHAHDVALANSFRAGLGLAPSNSAIVCADLPDARERLRGTPIMAATRAGQLRTSWHVYNTEDDVEAALQALARPGSGGPPAARS